jgi:hypothetical protein
VQWGSPFLVLRSDIRDMVEQHLYDVDACFLSRHEQWGLAIFGPCVYVCTMLEQYAYDFDIPICCRFQVV